MEIRLLAGCRVPGRATGRNDGIQNAAGPLGQRADSNRKKNFAPGSQERSAVPRETRSLVPPHGKFELSAYGGAVGTVAARDGDSLLPGLVSDAVHRSAIISCVDFFHFQFLFSFST